mmetsp:Transcript_22522/g.38148  ORF Transcript_22522/g.38148 Transcript_22522/m.38148 type:complete len:979 (+) Transcript_22522:126-3062(+)
MAALTRESSFERVLSNMYSSSTTNYEAIATQNEASRTISTWLKKQMKMKAVYMSMNSTELQTIESGLDALSVLDKESFLTGQEILTNDAFVKALSHFLNILPSDPSLKKRNKQARSVRIVSSSLLISQFPGQVLEDNGSPDQGMEAVACFLAAQLFKCSLKRLVRLVQKPQTSLASFRNSLIGYRFSLRRFLNAVDCWKFVDRDRLKHSFEVAYCESYMVIWTSQQMLETITEKLTTCSESDRPILIRERDENATFVQAGNARLHQFRDMLVKLLGPRESRALLEELDAYLLSSTRAMDVQVAIEGNELPPPAAQQKGDQQHRPEEVGLNLLSGTETAARTGTSSVDMTSRTTSESAAPTLSPEAAMLRRVSMISGLSENKILHELCLNSKFQLPDPLPPLRPFCDDTDGYSPTKHASIALSEASLIDVIQRSSDGGKDVLKSIMIQTMEERFVANMTKSEITLFSEVAAGGVYPVWYGSSSADTPDKGTFMFAQVLNVNKEGGTFSCRYIVDGLVENNVSSERVKLSKHPRNAVRSGFLSFVDDARSRIVALIPPQSQLHAELKTAFDLDLLKQMVENDAMNSTDLVTLLSTIVDFVTKLQSPHASSEFMEWFNPFAMYLQSQSNIDDALVYVPKFFEICAERFDQIQLEMSNYYLSSLASSSLVSREAMGNFKQTIDDRIEELERNGLANNEQVPTEDVTRLYCKYLPRTKQFLLAPLKEPLSSIVQFLKDIEAIEPDAEHLNFLSLGIGNEESKKIDHALVARAFSCLLQQNVDLGKSDGSQILPETFLWDGERLRNLKNEIDSLVLVTTLLISCRSYLLSVKKRLSPEQEITLQNNLYEVMRDSNVSLMEVVTTAQNYVRINFGDETLGSPLPSGWDLVLEESLKKCVTQTSPVFSLFLRRVHDVLVRAVLDVPFTDLLGRYSMNSRSQLQQLKVIIQLGKSLFSHNSTAFSEVYSSMLKPCCIEIDASSAKTS